MSKLDRREVTSRHELHFIGKSHFFGKFRVSVAQRVIVFLTVPLVFMLAMVAYGRQSSGNPPIEEAKRAYVEGHFLKARDQFSQASKADPPFADRHKIYVFID